jgi:hypothetical protein
MEFEKDITGYGRKMGRDAGLSAEGRLDGVHKLTVPGETALWEGKQPSNTIQARTMNPGGTETEGGQGNIGDYAPTYGRDDGVTGNPRGPPAMNTP